MNILKHEIKMNLKTLLIWSLSVGIMCLCFVLIYPSMMDGLKDVASSYASMGGFSKAFGLDKLSIASIEGFYATEIGAMYALGGAMFAALIGAGMLSKEECGHTGEFLFTLPVSRKRIVLEKMLVLFILIIIFNVICILCSGVGLLIIGEKIAAKPFILFHLSQLVMHLEIGLICYAISSFSRKNNFGVAIGIALVLYFLDLMSRLVDDIKWIKYFTPYYYSNSSDIFTNKEIDTLLIVLGLAISIVAGIISFAKYTKKDLAS